MSNDNTVSSGLTIGLDVGDRHSVAVVLDSQGEVVEEVKVSTSPKGLRAAFESRPIARVALEAGTHSPWISELLSSLGHEVVVANPRKVALISQNHRKSDRVPTHRQPPFAASLWRSPVSAILLTLAACGPGPGDLIEAARNGDVDGVRAAIAGGADVNERTAPGGWTALHYAAADAHVECVEALVAAGADVHAVGTIDPARKSGTIISLRPLVAAQSGLALLDYIKEGKITAASAGVPTDVGAKQRFEKIISLLSSRD